MKNDALLLDIHPARLETSAGSVEGGFTMLQHLDAPAPSKTIQVGFRWVRFVLGLVLIVAALLKLHAFLFDPTVDFGLLIYAWQQVAVIEIEMVLGLWLLSGWRSQLSRKVALVFFLAVTGFSLYLALIGQKSCGCLGKVELSPWWTFSFDLIAVVLLLLFRPAVNIAEPTPSWLRNLGPVAGGAALVLGGVLSGLAIFGDQMTEMLARWRGDTLVVDSGVVQLGIGQTNEWREVTVHARNLTDHPIRIVGGNSSCVCMTTKDLPKTIPPHGNEQLRVDLRFKGSPGRFQHRFSFYTDDHPQGMVVVRFIGRIVP